MATPRKPLVIDLTDGRTKQIPDADSLIVGTGITSAAGSLTLSANGADIFIDAGKTLSTNTTGNINLPNNANARFKIEGTSVGATVTASNLDILTNGSDATALHTHSTGNVVTATSGEGIAAGEQVGFENSAGSPRVFKADAGAAGNRRRSVGVANAASLSGAPVFILTSGAERAISDAAWEGGTFPAAADVGKPVFLAKTTPGCATLTVAAYVAGDTVQQVGVVSRGGAGAAKIVVEPLDEIVL